MPRLRKLEARVRKLEGQQRRKPPQRFYEERWDDLSRDAKACAERFSVGVTAVTRWYKQVAYDRALDELRKFQAQFKPVNATVLPPSHFDWQPEHIPLLIEGFLEFRGTYFRTPQRAPYETPDFQRKWASTLLGSLVGGGREMILAPQRHGKRLADDTPVLTGQGWRTHGDLQVGDMVYAPDGQPARVIAVSPPGSIDWRVTFSDGEVIDAHSDHRWWVYDRGLKRYRMVDTKEMVAAGLHQGTYRAMRDGERTGAEKPRARFLLDYCNPLQAPETDLPLDPYFLGVWLGDGTADGATVCGSSDDLAEILVELKTRGFEPSWDTTHTETGVEYVGFRNVRVLLKELDLRNNKHIPDVYYTASENQRRDLLRGLVDTDGHVETSEKGHGRVRFVTCSTRLANDVSRLVSTLGYRPSTTTQPPHLSTSGIQGRQDVHTVQWTPHDGEQQAYLARKDIRHHTLRQRRSVTAIEPLAEPKSGKCITVDHPSHQYLAGETLTPTHNSMLLRHLCIYLICLDPNIRILWVSAAQRTAEKTTGLIRGIFASSRDLADTYAGIGASFVPDRKSPHKWTNQEFTVATRTDFDINGPNMQALGREGTILSLDADIIIVDDIEDKNSVNQFGTRMNTKEWWDTQLSSRKEEHTGVFIIGSRQHSDDLYSYLLANDQYNVTVEQAHDPACTIEGNDGHWDCLLFPEVRSYKWLMGQKLAMSSPGRWEMIYQNVARTAGLVVFPEEDLHACRHPMYTAGVIPGKAHGATGGIRLVGGLDPAISGYQAGVLFAYQTSPELKVWLVDLDNKQGGGEEAFASLIRLWWEKYHLASWVAEMNLLGDLSSKREIRDFTSRHGIHVRDSHTGHNKNHQFMGVTGMTSLFKNQNIILPYSDAKSQSITDEVINQFAIWDEGNSRNKNRTGFKDDIVMAAWLAWQQIRRDNQTFNAEMGVDTGNYDGFTYSDVPWTTILEAV